MNSFKRLWCQISYSSNTGHLEILNIVIYIIYIVWVMSIFLTLFLTRNFFDREGGRSAPPLLTLVLFELQKIQRQFWKALKKWAWVFKVPERLKMSSSPAKTPSKNWTFCKYQYVWQKSYYTRKRQLTLRAQCGSCVWDIVTISVLSGVLLP